MNNSKLFYLYDKPIDLMTEKERDEYWLSRTGEHYHEPTAEEIQKVKEKYGLSD